jgi:DNA-binding GntR family transcriptional regulator
MDPKETRQAKRRQPAPAATLSPVATLRKLIADGRFPAGSRIGEEAVAQALGVSRTPVRLAFRTLEQEGLLQLAGKRGYVVREFSAADVLCAVDEAAKPKRAVGPQSLSAYLASSHGAGATKGPAA